jgi:hypothetical protein
MTTTAAPRLVHRTAHLRLRLTRRQARRCYGMLRSAGDVWAWLLDTNRQRHRQGEPAISNYQALCRLLTGQGPFGELSTVGARSVLRRYSDAWFQAAKRRKAGQQDAGFPRRKHALVPVRCYHGTFLLDGNRVRLPVAKGQPELWVRLARPLPYPPEQVRAVTLLADGGRLWLAVTAAVPVQQHDLDRGKVAGVDLGIIHPYAVVTQDAGLLVSGRALRAESYLHLKDQQARRAKAARRAPRPGGAARAAGAATGPACAAWRHAIAAASTRPSIGRPGRWSASPSSTRLPPWWWATQPALPSRLRAGCRTGGCGSGAAPTLCRHYGTRPSRWASWCGWWTSGHLLHLPRLPAAGPQARRAPVLLSVLRVPGAPGSGGCRQHRRHGRRRTHQRRGAGAGRAPSGRQDAGAA